MAIIFFGTPNFAIPSLKALIDAKEDIKLVVTQPDKKMGRGHILKHPPVKDLALSSNIKVEQPHDIRTNAFYQEIYDIQPEFIIVVAYGKLLPKTILSIPLRGCINIHASLLPKYRGAAPIQWALINGETQTGITSMLMDDGLDTGDILLQKIINIEENDNSATLSIKLSHLGAKTLIETINGVRNAIIKPVKQSGHASYAPTLRKENGRIAWDKDASQISNFIRGMYPWPSAYTYLKDERIKIIKSRPIEGEGVPGRVELASDGKLIVGTAKGLLLIEELQPDGKKIMTASAFISGRKLKEKHDRFD